MLGRYQPRGVPFGPLLSQPLFRRCQGIEIAIVWRAEIPDLAGLDLTLALAALVAQGLTIRVELWFKAHRRDAIEPVGPAAMLGPALRLCLDLVARDCLATVNAGADAIADGGEIRVFAIGAAAVGNA